MESLKIWSFFVATLIGVSLADDWEYKLVQDLMSRYDRRIRPSRNASEALNVTFGLALSQLIDVDEKNQAITLNCWLNQQWVDPKLSWNASLYNGIKVVRLPYQEIWLPDIILYNTADATSYSSGISTNVIVSSEGNVTWLSAVILKSSCSVDVRYFPFDEQNCSLLFASWTYDGFQVDMKLTSAVGDTSNYVPNVEWELVKLHVARHVVKYSCCEEPYPDLTYTVQIRRRPLFYVFNMVLPCVLITLVALLGFYVPPDSGEKIGMGITTLLSMTVFLMLVSEIMPPNSDTLPLIAILYGVTIAIVSFATAFSVMTLNIHHKGLRGKGAPRWVKKLCFDILAPVMCIPIERPCTQDDDEKPHHKILPTTEIGQYMKMKKQLKEQDKNSSVLSFSHLSPLDGVSIHRHVVENGGCSPLPSLRNQQTHTTNQERSEAALLGDRMEKILKSMLHTVQEILEKSDGRVADEEKRDAIKLEWQQIAIIVDRLMLYFFVCITLAVTLVVMFSSPHALYLWKSSPAGQSVA